MTFRTACSFFETCPITFGWGPDRKAWPQPPTCSLAFCRTWMTRASCHTLSPRVHAWWIKTWRTIFSSENVLFTILQIPFLLKRQPWTPPDYVLNFGSLLFLLPDLRASGLVNERGKSSTTKGVGVVGRFGKWKMCKWERIGPKRWEGSTNYDGWGTN